MCVLCDKKVHVFMGKHYASGNVYITQLFMTKKWRYRFGSKLAGR